MDARKKKQLEKAGFRVGSTTEFLELSSADEAMIEMRLALADSLAKRRKAMRYSQVKLAKRLGSSQSRVAKMEAGDPSVSVDLGRRDFDRQEVEAAVGTHCWDAGAVVADAYEVRVAGLGR